MILINEAYSETSLRHDIESLESPNVPITAVQLANIITKYIACLMGDSVDKKMPYPLLKDVLWETIRVLNSTSRSDSDSIIKSLRYQLEMIFDIPATIETMEDIIHNTEKRRQARRQEFTWLDLWTWSWILMVAQYIWAKRSGVRNPKITGIEFEPLPQLFSNVLIRKLWIWEVKLGDVKDISIYPEEEPDGISIELLPTTWAPFLHFRPELRWGWEDYEPFLETVSTVSKTYGRDIFARAQTFPRWLEIGSIFRPGVTKWLSEDRYGLVGLDIDKVWRNTAASYYPKMILIGNQWKRLDEVGDIWLLPMFEWARNLRRWSHLWPQVIESIYRNQRKMVDTSKVLHI